MVMAGTTTRYVFDLQPADVFWCTADCGWCALPPGWRKAATLPALSAWRMLFDRVPAQQHHEQCLQQPCHHFGCVPAHLAPSGAEFRV